MTKADGRAAGILAALFLWLVWFAFSGGWDADLSAVYFAAYSYGIGQHDLIYQSRPMFFGASASDAWDSLAAQMGYEGQTVLPYLYAPIWAAVLAPVSVSVPPAVFFNGMLMVHAAACLGSMALVWRMVRPTGVSFGLWMLISVAIASATTPFFMGFWLNQPQFLVVFLVLLAFERAQSGRPMAAGIALGVAAAIKITPALFVVVFLMDRNWRAASWFALTGAFLLLISIAMAGLDMHAQFLEQLQRAGAHIVLTPINFSLEGVVTAWSVNALGGDIDQPFVVMEMLDWVGMLSKLGLVLSVAALWWLTRSTTPERASFGRLLALWCCLILFGPLGWSHYLVGPLLLLPAVLAYFRRGWAIFWIVVVVALLSHPAHIALRPMDLGMGVLMAIGALTLVVMAVVAVAAARPVSDS